MRWWPALPVLGLLASTLTACDSSGRLYSINEDDEYVAIGDSYTAAPRTGFPDGDDGCHRTDANYPHLVAHLTGAELHDVSCSGAATAQLTDPWKPGSVHLVAPQLDALSDATDLVTVGIGANDFHLIGIVFVTCPTLAVQQPDAEHPCLDAARNNPNVTLSDLFSQMEDNVTASLEDVVDRAPNAKVLVIGYPSIVPPSGTCDQLPLAPGDYPFARRIIDGINEGVAAAADRAGVDFIDTATGSAGHDICGKDPWIAGVDATGGDAAPLHPYPDEQDFVSKLVLDAIG